MTPPSRRGWLVRLAIVAVASAAGTSRAHPSVDERLRAIAQRAEAECKAAELVGLGNALRSERRFDEALAYYERAGACDEAAAASSDLERARLYLDAGFPRAAEALASHLISHRPDMVAVLVVRARARFATGRPGEAAADYGRAMPRLADLQPDLIVEQAQANERAGDLAAAAAALEAGAGRLGAVPQLGREAVRIELLRHRFEAALAWIDRQAGAGVAREQLLVERAEVLVKAGRGDEAKAALREALALLARRPARRRNVPALRDLERTIRRRLRE